MIPAVIGLASGTLLLLGREEEPAPLIGASLPTNKQALEVPLGLTRKRWLGFLKVSICGNPRTITPSFRLGLFGMTVRRLCDLGVMVNPRVIRYHKRQVWDADWADPKNLQAFQASPMLQYSLFVNSLCDYAKAPEVVNAIGQEVEGVTVTQSGALMIAHRAGLPGMVSWLADPNVRGKFTDNTTAFFKKANGIF